MNKRKLDFRKATTKDIEVIEKIYAYARNYMRKNGNLTQWGDNQPLQETILSDIKNGNLFLVLNPNICAVFAFIIGSDKTYNLIEEGAWLNDEPYGVIHRVASDGSTSGIMEAVIDYCQMQINNIRIDTHSDNKTMQHILEKNGFIKCGRIYVEDGSPRIAYHKVSR